MSVGINPVAYGPAFTASETAKQNVPQQTELPPSNKKYEKNGKSVRANIGPIGGGIFTLAFGSCLVSPCIANIIDTKKKIVHSEAVIEDHTERLKAPSITDFEKKQCQEVVDAHKGLLESYVKDIKSNKKCAVIAGVVGLVTTLGTIMITNHLRNKKRAALAAEPENPTLNKEA
jgi:hypothetical protein